MVDRHGGLRYQGHNKEIAQVWQEQLSAARQAESVLLPLLRSLLHHPTLHVTTALLVVLGIAHRALLEVQGLHVHP